MSNEYVPTYMTPPGETLMEVLESLGMSQSELAERTGRPKKTINEIIKGKASITPETAIQLERVLGTPASFWNNRERNYQEWLARQEQRQLLAEYIPWMKKFPLRSMIKMGWITEYGDPINQLEELLRYLGVASPLQWQTMLQGAQWRQSPTFAADPAMVSVWLRQGELQAQKIECQSYDLNHFQAVLHEIRKLAHEPPEMFVVEVVRLCAQAGVAVVFVPEITGNRISGATRWLTSTKALIMLSLRQKTDHHLWFTFFHEAAHIVLHGKREVFLEDDDEVSDDVRAKEEEANQLAEDFLIPVEEPRGK